MNKKNDKTPIELVTKSDLAIALEQQTQDLVQTVSDLFNDKIDKIQNGQDRMIGILETLQQENTVGSEQIRELRVKTEDHDKRITALESA